MIQKIIAWLNARIDKVAHFGFGYILTTILPIPFGWGFILMVMIAAYKEYLDKQGSGTADIWDFVATIAGGFLAILAMSLKFVLYGGL